MYGANGSIRRVSASPRAIESRLGIRDTALAVTFVGCEADATTGEYVSSLSSLN